MCILFKRMEKPDITHRKYERLSNTPPAEYLEQKQSSKTERNCRAFHERNLIRHRTVRSFHLSLEMIHHIHP